MDPEDLDALAAQAAVQKIRDFLTGIKSDVGIDNFVEVVGADLLTYSDPHPSRNCEQMAADLRRFVRPRMVAPQRYV